MFRSFLSRVPSYPIHRPNLIRRATVMLVCLLPFAAAGCGWNAGPPESHETAGSTNGGGSKAASAAGPASPIRHHQTNGGSAKSGTTTGQKPVTKPGVSVAAPTTMPDATTDLQDLGSVTGGVSASASAGGGKAHSTLADVVAKAHLKPTEEQIVRPYVAKLEGLQSQYIGQLYGLYDEARAEYHANHVNKVQIENKYVPRVLNLENSAQDQLNGLLFSLKAKLETEGYPATEVNVLRGAYYSEVAQMQAKWKR